MKLKLRTCKDTFDHFNFFHNLIQLLNSACMESIFVILLCCYGSTLFGQPDFILFNGKVFTSDKHRLWEEAVAIKGNRIIAVGKNEDIAKKKGRTTKLIDLRGHLVIPGFNDAHAHIGPDYPSHILQLSKNPADPTPWSKIQDSIRRAVSALPRGTMITASINPDLFEESEARRAALDILAPDHPVVLAAWTGHGKLVNTSAMKLLNLNEGSEFAGGRIDKNGNGRSTGYLEEYAGFGLSSTLTSKLSLPAALKELQAIGSPKRNAEQYRT